MSLNGRDPELAREIMANGVAVQYHKIAPVWAFPLSEALDIDTPEGTMHAEIGDYLVGDNPPTHLWPVKREVFERTYASQAEWSAFGLRTQAGRELLDALNWQEPSWLDAAELAIFRANRRTAIQQVADALPAIEAEALPTVEELARALHNAKVDCHADFRGDRDCDGRMTWHGPGAAAILAALRDKP